MNIDDRTSWRPGAWPLVGDGPREGLPETAVWPSRRDASGVEGPTEWGTRSGKFRRVGRNLWVQSEVPLDAAQRTVEAAAQLPSYGAVTGWAALHWAGARWISGSDRHEADLPVPLAIGIEHALRPGPGHTVSQEGLTPIEIMRLRGLRVTTHARSVAYEMRKAQSDEAAMIAFEMAAYNDLISVDELQAYTETRLPIRQGVERVRRLLPLLEENAWSPTEVIMRRTWVSAGWPRPLANRPVFDLSGRFVGTPDLIDAEAGVYGQYDGALHVAGAQRHADVAKEAAFRRLGLEPAIMMAGDLADRSGFVQRLADAFARAQHLAPERRQWTLAPPQWWIATHTVARRRALDEEQQSRLLRYRHAA